MEIVPYQDWMLEQITQLFVEEYGFDYNNFKSEFEALYSHPFQKSKAFRVAAIDGDVVMGYTSFLYWPLRSSQDELLEAYQCGNVIVGKHHRGKGVFSAILKAINAGIEPFDYDVLIGFPVEASYHGFVRKGWSSPFKLNWHSKIANPILSLFSLSRLTKENRDSLRCENFDLSQFTGTETALTPAFQSFRESILKGLYLIESIPSEDDEIYFEIKYQVRKRILVEAIIGKISKRSGKPFSEHDLKQIMRRSSQFMRATFFSIAITEQASSDALKAVGFNQMKNRQIHFISKDGKRQFAEETKGISLGRADIDTW